MSPPTGSLRALVADDHAPSAAACATALGALGFRATRALDPAAAGAGPFDLVVADAELPPSGAGDFLARLDAGGPTRNAHLVALLPPNCTDDLRRSAAEIADAILAKPFASADLAETVKRLADASGPPRRRAAASGAEGPPPTPPDSDPFGPAAALSQDDPKGMAFGGCRVESLLGRGGMGAVYFGKHEVLETPVAIKLLPMAMVQWDPDQMERFLRGARAAARIDHPNVAAVLHAGEENGYCYLITRYAEGESLGDILMAQGRLEIAAALRVLADAASGLAAAHRLGIVHRDVKPSNIIVADSGMAKLTDFGLARAAGDASVTAQSAIVGTPHYMAPEQCEGRPLDARADVYSLGATMYHCLTGRPPSQGKDPLAVLRSRLESAPPPIRSLRPDCPAPLNDLVHDMLARSPEERTTTAEEAAKMAGGMM